jgi:hypothetical protein
MHLGDLLGDGKAGAADGEGEAPVADAGDDAHPARIVTALPGGIGRSLDRFAPQECANCPANAG